MMKDDRDYYLYLRDRRITGNEYYPRVCIQYSRMNHIKKLPSLLGCRSYRRASNIGQTSKLLEHVETSTDFVNCHISFLSYLK